jgi:WD40 repeat protein
MAVWYVASSLVRMVDTWRRGVTKQPISMTPKQRLGLRKSSFGKNRREDLVFRFFFYRVLQDETAGRDGDLYIRSVSFSPDGKYLATGAEDKQIRVMNKG